MEITPETAKSLGNKLAELDLTAEEALLLSAALSDAGDDVTGFGSVPNTDGFEQAAPNLMPLVQAPVQQLWQPGDRPALWKSDGTAALWASDGTSS